MVERISSQDLTTTVDAPDEVSGRSWHKVFGVLLVVSIAICWMAMEVVEAAALTMPLVPLAVFHGLYIAVVLVAYPLSIRRNASKLSLEVE
ncbi:MAG: hypothetical protein AM324_010070 [Candidatus Thorarchaeota archaeon SMTZ1-83]